MRKNEMALVVSAGQCDRKAKKEIESASLLDVSSLGLSGWSDLAVLSFKPIVTSHSARTTRANGTRLVSQ
jgi:microsomal dipeptidase-like Zn-dependent dipeptidase